MSRTRTLVALLVLETAPLACHSTPRAAEPERDQAPNGEQCVSPPELEVKIDPVSGLVPIPRPWGTDGAGPGGPQYWKQALPAFIAEVDGARRVTVGVERACALMKGGSVRCWTQPGEPPGGPNTLERQKLVVMLRTPEFTDATSLAIGRARNRPDVACAIAEGGKVLCWSLEPDRELNLKTIRGLDDAVELSLSPSSDFGCALTRRGTVACWGRDGFLERMGLEFKGPTDAVEHPRLSGVTRVSAGPNGFCALGRTLECTDRTPTLEAFSNAHGPFKDLVVIQGSVCGLSADDIACLSLGSNRTKDEPFARIRHLGPAQDVRKLAVGVPTACALLHDGRVKCLDYTPPTYGSYTESSLSAPPVEVQGVMATDISVGRSVCAVTGEGKVTCWGYIAESARIPECVPEAHGGPSGAPP